MTVTLFFLSISPFILFMVLLLWKKSSLLVSSLAILVYTTLLYLAFWQVYPINVFNSYIKGSMVAFDIFLIIVGAIFFLLVLKDLKVLDNIGYYLKTISPDYRIQVILLAWLFQSFLEGTAGFGTPAAVVGPLLVSLGLSPLLAAIIALMGNSTAGIFGATGTPIRIGFAGLNVESVDKYAALINHIGIIVPIFMLWTLVSSQKNRRQQFWECFPFALWSGIAFVVPSYISVFLGQEFPSVLGSLMGIILVIITIKLNLFNPPVIRQLKISQPSSRTINLIKDILPYLLLIIFLLAGKYFLGSSSLALKVFSVNHKFALFNPGFAFIITGIITSLIFIPKISLIGSKIIIAIKNSIQSFLVIIAMSTVTQLMINSNQNASSLSSSLEYIANVFQTGLLPFWTPFIGAFGAFITGSITISNLMFGNLLSLASQSLGINTAKILALEVVGAAAGNMIALSDILTAETVMGLKNQERQVIKGVFVPCLIYLLITGFIGLLFI